MLRWLKDPVTSFVLAGTVIFAVSSFFPNGEISNSIQIKESDLERMIGIYEMQRGRQPSKDELNDLVDQFIKDEIYFRESLRLGLDVNDSIIRRRLVQKLTFLTEDIATIQPISSREAAKYFDQNAENYRVPKRYSFSHRYFSPERREDAEGDARRALSTGDEGDRFMLQREYTDRSLSQIRSFLGDEFANEFKVLEAQTSSQGPIKSSYGWHTILMSEVKDSYIPDFETVRNRVLSEATIELRSSANDVYYDELKSRYDIAYPESAMR